MGWPDAGGTHAVSKSIAISLVGEAAAVPPKKLYDKSITVFWFESRFQNGSQEGRPSSNARPIDRPHRDQSEVHASGCVNPFVFAQRVPQPVKSASTVPTNDWM